MAKDEIVRTAIGAAESVAVNVKQSEVNALLKKKNVEVAEKDEAKDHSADADQAAAIPAEGEVVAEVADASDSLGIASDAGISPSILLSGASEAGGAGESGISTTTLLVGGGVLLAGAAIAIASNSDDDGGDDDVVVPPPSVTSVAAPASANEGTTVSFTLTGTPGSTVAYTLTGTAAQGTDYTVPAGNSVTFGLDGKAVVTVSVIADGITEGAETIILTAGGQSATVSIADTSIPVPEQFVLTTDRDVIEVPATNGVDVIRGSVIIDEVAGEDVDTIGDRSTFSANDVINGNGQTQLKIGLQGGSLGEDNAIPVSGPLTTVTDVDGVDFESNLRTAIVFDASNWSNVGDISLGGDSLIGPSIVSLINLEADTGLSVSSNTTTLTGTGFPDPSGQGLNLLAALYENREVAVVGALGEGAALSYSDDKAIGSAEEDGSVLFYLGDSILATLGGAGAPLGIPPISAPGLELSVDEITLTGENSLAAIAIVAQLQLIGGDVTVGDVTSTGFDASLVAVVNSGHSANSPAVDTTVGNVVIESNDLSENLLSTLAEPGPGINILLIGNGLPIGDTNPGEGEGEGWENVLSGFGGDIDASALFPIGVTNKNQTGNVSTGDITYTVGENNVGIVVVASSAENDDSDDDVTIGDTTTGNLLYDVGQGGALISAVAAIGYGDEGDVTIGNVTVGNVKATIASDAAFQGAIGAQTYADPTSPLNNTTTIGDITVGDIDLTGGDDNSDIIFGVTALSFGGDDGVVGDTVIGDVSVEIEVDSSADLLFNAMAQTDVGDFTMGDVRLIAGIASVIDSAGGPGLITVIGQDGTVGDVTIGSLTASSITGGAVIADIFVQGDSDVGQFSLGDVSLSASGTNSADMVDAYTQSRITVISNDGDIDGVDVGNVTTSADLLAAVDFRLNVVGSDNSQDVIAGTSVGNITATGGKGSDTRIDTLVAGIDSDIEIGNIKVTLNGGTGVNQAQAELYFGHLDTLVFNPTGGAVPGEPGIGNLTTGNIEVSAAGDNTVATTDDTVVLQIYGENSLEIGNIIVSGTSEDLESFNTAAGATNVASWITFGPSDDITIDSVDYRGFVGTASGVENADGAYISLQDLLVDADVPLVFGSTRADEFVDNGNVTSFTGFGGADDFVFVSANVGNTEIGSIDQITDYVNDGVNPGDEVQFLINNGEIAGGVVIASVGDDFESFNDLLLAADSEFGGGASVFIGTLNNDNAFAVVDANADGNFDGNDDYIVQFTGIQSTAQIFGGSITVGVDTV